MRVPVVAEAAFSVFFSAETLGKCAPQQDMRFLPASLQTIRLEKLRVDPS
jgi:hypothetical protein